MTLQELVRQAQARLAGDSARLDAELLLANVLGKSRSYLYTWPDREASGDQVAAFMHLVEARAAGQPVAYLLGEREFWSLPLKVSPHTLIPRPETELLVELALTRLPPVAPRVLDLGTGTGAIALALASERPDADVWAVDASEQALAVARDNARHLGLPLTCVHGHWFDALAEQCFHMILSNPPYIADNDHHLEQGDVRFEPRTALVSGSDGLRDIREIVAGAPAHLLTDGWLLLEHGYEQGDAVRRILQAQGFSQVQTLPDLAGRDRVSLGRWEAP